jgi:hypothetical protein
MSWYDVLVFLHVTGAIIWVGGSVLVNVLVARAKHQGGDTLRAVMSQVAWLGGRYFGTVGGVVLGLGIWMVATSDVWSFTEFFVIFGILGYAVSATIGGALLGPLSKRAGEAIENSGPDSNAAKAAVGRFLSVARLDTLVLLAVVFNMVTKPGA